MSQKVYAYNFSDMQVIAEALVHPILSQKLVFATFVQTVGIFVFDTENLV